MTTQQPMHADTESHDALSHTTHNRPGYHQTERY